MVTVFDYLTVACFLGVAGAFLILTNREPRTLLQLLLGGALFDVANQVGNAGYAYIGAFLVIAGLVYSMVAIRLAWSV